MKLLCFAIASWCGLLNSVCQGASIQYSVIDLGTLPGGTLSEAGAINAGGDVTGNADTVGGGRHVFLYSQGKMSDLGTLKGFGSSIGNSINSKQQIVGAAHIHEINSSPESAFLSESDVLVALKGVKRYSESRCWDVNESGQSTGSITMEGLTAYTHAFLYSGGSLTDLGTLVPKSQPWHDFPPYSEGFAVNNQGQIVGSTTVSRLGTDGATHQHAFLYVRGRMTDLGVPPGFTDSQGSGLNDQGQVIGSTFVTSRQDPRAQNRCPFLWNRGQFTVLKPSHPDEELHLAAINDAGEAVGTDSYDLKFHPILYKDGKVTDLNVLIPTSAGILLEQANGINDHGQIVATGTHDGKRRAFLLTRQP
ncbi:MAG: DUF3466 family protein [Armatimonadota bacterium]|nr:DUF3466 family protein [Armatimonadota bacterium]